MSLWGFDSENIGDLQTLEPTALERTSQNLEENSGEELAGLNVTFLQWDRCPKGK